MIGDSKIDAAASAAAGIGFIAVKGGYGDEKSPEEFPGPPALIVDSLLELLDSERKPIEMLGRFGTFSG
jgi:phosphoglycolate phosphatase-like HAD superfamily hydrolase